MQLQDVSIRAIRADGRWLLVCDVDDTLIGDVQSLRSLSRALRASSGVFLALNSSRPWPSVRRTLRDQNTPLPYAATICAMGTHLRVGGMTEPAWAERFAGWDRRIIDDVMSGLGFQPHPAEFQTPLKASFAVPRELWPEVRAHIETAGIPVCIVTSGTSDFDVLPAGAGKDHATVFLADHLGVARDRLIVAGDSGNDLAMFRVAARGIVVGNARPGLREAVDPAKAYFASGHYAAGILEGLRHYSVLCGEDRVPRESDVSTNLNGVGPCRPIDPTS